MNKAIRKILFILLFPFSRIIRLIQNKMDFLRSYQLKLVIARVLQIIRWFNQSSGSVKFPDTIYSSTGKPGKMKIGVIDHSYHYKTVSPAFFVKLLTQIGSVRVMWDSRWNGGRSPSVKQINLENFDILVLWQIMIYYQPEKLRKLNCRQIIIVPMYDDIHADPDKLFLGFSDYRFISFCRDLHQRLKGLNLRSQYWQYYADPASLPFSADSFGQLKGFFWQRTNDITWEQIRPLISEANFTSFHLHLALDPIWYREVLPTEEEMEKYHITITRWFENKADYLKVLMQSNVFFTPRLYEGIGMPVIESMTMGKLVVSPDYPTMNEYIRNGHNGLLYHLQDLKPLDFTDAARMALQAREDSMAGFARWQEGQQELQEYIIR